MSRALVALGLVAVSGCVHVIPLPEAAELHRARTDDGWELALTRYRAVGEPRGLPVILCHGIGANARNMDLDDEHSMARFFSRQGREAWTVSLRAAGDSDRPDEGKGRRPGFTFDDYWRHDLPAAIGYVRRVSGASAVDWVGHSMGGLVLYAYLSQGGQGVNAGSTLGTPTRLDWGLGFEGTLTALAPSVLAPSWLMPTATASYLIAPLEGTSWDGPLERFFYNRQSTQPRTWQRLMAYGTSDISGGVAAQLARLMETGEFLSADRSLDFKRGLADVKVPLLVVAAKLDRVAIPPSVKDGFRALGGPKEWLLITRANGARGEYGHMDLIIGERAADEVWAKVLDFLNRHPRKEP